MPTGDDHARARALGSFIRMQRELANLSVRATAARAGISNPYLSQLERGLHEPSVRVLSAVARALHIPAETLLHEAGLVDTAPEATGDGETETAIRRDPYLSAEQREALLSVYRSYRAANDRLA